MVLALDAPSLAARLSDDIIETGTMADGRFFELMEYLPDGSLRTRGAGRHTFDPASIKEIVRQLP